jgi:hypothetical protein
MIFGGVEENQIHGSLYDLPLVNNDWWAAEFNEFLFGEISLKKYSKFIPGRSIF